MDGADNTLITHWLIPIATNIIAAIIMYLGKPSLALGKRLFAKGKNKLNVRAKFTNKPISASLRYLAWVSIGILPIAYNVFELYRYLRALGPPSRAEVFALFFYIGLTTYWIRTTISKIKHYGPQDFI
jgi:hypothetical protein